MSWGLARKSSSFRRGLVCVDWAGVDGFSGCPCDADDGDEADSDALLMGEPIGLPIGVCAWG